MKKNVRILSIVLITLTIIATTFSVAYAVSPTDVVADTTIDGGTMTTLGGKIFGGLQIFGTIGAVLILAVLGIKYMMSSPEGKADYKANMVPYIVGAILLFGATSIANLVYNALQ